MSEEMEQLKATFDGKMLDIYRQASQQCGYKPKAFLAMVFEHGGVETAKKLLASREIQSGLYELFRCGRLDLAMGSLVLVPEYGPLFSTQELGEARRRIDSLKRRG